MKPIAIDRVLVGSVRGSSRPVLAATRAGNQLVKLRGAAQGTGALIAEMVVAELAEALDLPVLPRCLVSLDPTTPIDDQNDELADLLNASVGTNLAFPMLENCRDATDGDFEGFTPEQRAAVLWLDRFVLNPDRNVRNPNVLWDDGEMYLIDHGAALRFQYNWPAVTEDSPRQVGEIAELHLFDSIAKSNQWHRWEAEFASRITRAVLQNAMSEVPDSFLRPLISPSPRQNEDDVPCDAIERRRAAYVAYLWKRLKSPRAFAIDAPRLLPNHGRGVHPSWVNRRN